MVKRSKRYQSAFERVDRDKVYEPSEALGLLKELPAAKFDETVEIAMNLGVDLASSLFRVVLMLGELATKEDRALTLTE